MNTKKGTELPLLNLRGKDYLEVKYRLVWFREEHPTWGIETEFLYQGEAAAIAKATIKDDAGRILATAHKHEDKKGFPDFLEKAETGAVGRALALIGYGTQFAPELEEGERIVDSPVDRKPALKAVSAPETTDYVITIGKKYKGKRLTEVPTHELESFRTWLVDTADKDGKPLSPAAQEFIHAVDAYVGA